MDPELCLRLEEAALNAWPAIQQLHYDGWLLRFAWGYTRRANSVNALAPGTLETAAKIAYCEQVYRQMDLPPIFRLTPLSAPDLDAELAARGYQRQHPTWVMTLDLDLWRPPAGLMPLRELGLDPWLGVYDRVSAALVARRAFHRQILGSIIPPILPAALELEGAWAACGLGVLERGWLGLFDIVTRADLRQQGLGTQLVAGMLAWGQSQGARLSYLQVLADNPPARRLYARLGYQDRYCYWYRTPAELG